MNDNDIINAIAGCVNSSTKCNECIFIDEVCDGEDCKEIALRYAIDIISRQKAEIDGLYKLNLRIREQGYKSAIKEFAERLKGNFAGGWLEMDEDWFEKFVKEMVGEDK